MRLTLKLLTILTGAMGTLMLTAATISPREADSNVAEWLSIVGVDRPPSALVSTGADSAVTALAIILLVVAAIGAWEWFSGRQRQTPVSRAEPAPEKEPDDAIYQAERERLSVLSRARFHHATTAPLLGLDPNPAPVGDNRKGVFSYGPNYGHQTYNEKPNPQMVVVSEGDWKKAPGGKGKVVRLRLLNADGVGPVTLSFKGNGLRQIYRVGAYNPSDQLGAGGKGDTVWITLAMPSAIDSFQVLGEEDARIDRVDWDAAIPHV